MFWSLLLIRTKFDDELQERRYASVKTEILGTKVSQIGFFFVFYSVCKTKQPKSTLQFLHLKFKNRSVCLLCVWRHITKLSATRQFEKAGLMIIWQLLDDYLMIAWWLFYDLINICKNMQSECLTQFCIRRAMLPQNTCGQACTSSEGNCMTGLHVKRRQWYDSRHIKITKVILGISYIQSS